MISASITWGRQDYRVSFCDCLGTVASESDQYPLAQKDFTESPNVL